MWGQTSSTELNMVLKRANSAAIYCLCMFRQAVIPDCKCKWVAAYKCPFCPSLDRPVDKCDNRTGFSKVP